MPTTDLTKRRARAMRWKRRHPEMVRAEIRAYGARNPVAVFLRRAVEKMLKYNKSNLGRNPLYDTYLGCTREFLRGYVEALFLPGMTWENHGEWHMDHIRPLSSFDFAAHPEDVYLAGHYTNLQPMWKAEHLIKGARYEMEAIDEPIFPAGGP